MGIRSRGRKALLQARYAMEVNSGSLLVNLEDIRLLLADSDLGLGVPMDSEDWNWVSDLARAVHYNKAEINTKIEEALENWTLDRLSLVTRLILQQAVGEMYFSEPPTPPPVVIDESINLAKIFDTDETAGFVNGVLDAIIKTHDVSASPDGN
ncbi:transcription antitermination factor NusB [Candidatus Fermentibacteria bacterium]|nr:MAG: transcription antitermination factor NusB [Candidatus Fermentibacteria bacterium]